MWISCLRWFRRWLGPFPVARMCLAPLLHSPDLVLPPMIIATETGEPPAALTGHLTGLTTSRRRTETLVMPVAVIREEELPATTTLAPTRFASHRLPSRKNKIRKSNQKNESEEEAKRRKKKSFQSESPKKTRTEENRISNRQVSSTFIPPLTTVGIRGPNQPGSSKRAGRSEVPGN